MLSFLPVGPEPVPSPLPSPQPGAGPRPPPTPGPAWEDSGLALLLQGNHRETDRGEGFGLGSWRGVEATKAAQGLTPVTGHPRLTPGEAHAP